MKGLLIKDYYCLKKSLKTFFILTIGVIIIGVMFALSMKYGNMATAATGTAAEVGMDEGTVFDMFRIAVWLVIVIPTALVGNVTDCFKEDMRAGFGKELFSLPVTSWQIVGARYAACLIYALVSFVGALITSLCISGASEEYPFIELLSVAVIFGSIMLGYLCIVMCFIYLIGTKYADYIQAVPIILALVLAIVFVNVKMMDMEETEFNAFTVNVWRMMKEFITHNAGVFLVITVVIFMITYIASVKIVERKRGTAIC